MDYLKNIETPVSIEDLKSSQGDGHDEPKLFLCVGASKDTFSGRRLRIQVLRITGKNVTCKILFVLSGDEYAPLPNDDEKYVPDKPVTVDINQIFPSNITNFQ